jgi:DNA repair protein RecN (Recombination protein N)
MRNEYFTKFKFWNAERKNLVQLKERLALSLQQSDYNRFQLEELEELHLEKHNYQDLEIELTRNENIDGLKSTLDAIVSAVENEEGASSTLRKLKTLLERSKGVDSVVDELAQRIQSSLIELEDIAGEAENYLEKIEIDPERLSELTLLLDHYNRVLRKHNLLNQEQLVELKGRLSADLDDTGELQSLIELKTEEVSLLKTAIDQLAENLHQKRITSAGESEESVKTLLADLKMPDTQFVFDFVKREELNNHGCTDVKMLFSPNRGMQPISIEKAASGGELSRLMLALQNLVSSKKQLPTIIFDEIDTGVSGEVAQKIGALLKKMGDNLQLLAITHLPQVAGKADFHFKVEKSLNDNRTRTNVRVLSELERIEEIARLMSGEEINEAALLNAKALMN